MAQGRKNITIVHRWIRPFSRVQVHGVAIVWMIISFLLFATHNVYAQDYSYTHYDTRDGVAAGTTYNIVQDKDGFIWFGTEAGLCRFDGVHFKMFTEADGLPSNEVTSEFIDSKNRIWILSLKNTIAYYYKGKIHNQQNDSVLRKLSLLSEIVGIAETDKGEIFIQGPYQLYIITPDKGVQKIDHGSLVSLGYIRASYRKGQRFKLMAGNGSIAPQISDLPQHILDFADFEYSYKPNFWNSGYPSNTYLFVKRGKFIEFFINKGRSHYSMDVPRDVGSIKLINDSILAIMKNPQGVVLYNILSQKYIAEYLPDYTINDVFGDIEGSLWFSTKGAGIFKTSAVFINNTLGSGTIPLAAISIHKLNNTIYIGAENATYWKLNPVINRYDNDNYCYQAQSTKPDISLFPKNKKKQFINYSNSDFLDVRGVFNENINVSQCAIKSMVYFNDTMLVTSYRLTQAYNMKNMSLIAYIHIGRATCAYRLNGIYYIGTLDGLYASKEGKLESFLGREDSLLKNSISGFAEGDDGTLWIATSEAGVIGYKNDKVIANITKEHGNLSSNICRSLFVTGNTLWVGTEKGLNKVDINRGKYIATAQFNTIDGLSSNVINTIFVDSDIVYVGTPKGVTYFNERKVPRRSICDVKITGITVSDSEINPNENNLVLEHKDNNIRIDFIGISFLSGGSIIYKYRLLGLSDDWKTTTEASLNYPSLPSGKYRLQLMAINRFNEKSPILEKSFEIKKLLWEKVWFQLAILVLLIILVIVIVRISIRRASKKEREKHLTKQKIIELEQMALRAQMNPHFIFNCLNSIQHYILKQDGKGANFYLSRFARLVRKTLDNSTRIYISLTEEINYLSDYIELEKLQLTGVFDYTVTVDPVIQPDHINVPNMVIQPYIENAIKHGVGGMESGGKIALSFSLDGSDTLKCVLEDNGKGIKFTQKNRHSLYKDYESKGMSITHSRIETLNQLYSDKKPIGLQVEEILTENNIVAGTRVSIYFHF